MNQITLTEEECAAAQDWAAQLKARKHARGYKDRAGVSSDDSDLIGRCGEIAVGKLLGIAPRDDLNNFTTTGDVGPYEVRTTKYPPGIAKLKIHPKDAHDRIFIGVAKCSRLEYAIIGWIRAGEAMVHSEWWADPGNIGGCWWVPQEHLHPMSTLPSLEEATTAKGES